MTKVAAVLAYVYAAGVSICLLAFALAFLWVHWKKLRVATRLTGDEETYEFTSRDPEFVQGLHMLGGRIVPKPMNARRDAQAEEEAAGEEVRFGPASGRILSVITAVVLAFLWPIVLGSCFTSTPMLVFSLGHRDKGGHDG